MARLLKRPESELWVGWATPSEVASRVSSASDALRRSASDVAASFLTAPPATVSGDPVSAPFLAPPFHVKPW